MESSLKHFTSMILSISNLLISYSGIASTILSFLRKKDEQAGLLYMLNGYFPLSCEIPQEK